MNEIVLEDFARGYQEYNGLSARRRRRQMIELGAFAEALAPRSLLDADADDFRAFLEQQIEKGKVPSTVLFIRNLIRPFYHWAHTTRRISAEAWLGIAEVAAPRGADSYEPRPYDQRERQRFWREFEATYPWVYDLAWGQRKRGENSYERGRYYFDRWLHDRSQWARASYFARRLQAEAIVSLAMYGGLRRSEIYSLELDDLDPDNEYVIVHGAAKGEGSREPRMRAVPWVCQAMRDSVHRWLVVRGEILAHLGLAHDRPWLNLRLGQLGSPLAFDPFRATVARCGPWELHRMRHTAATAMIAAGYPIGTVSKILGHANIAMTMRYVKFVPSDIVDQARASQGRYEQRMDRPDAA